MKSQIPVNPFLRLILSPAIRLMEKRGIAQKFLLFAAASGFVLALMGYGVYTHLQTAISISRSELEGIHRTETLFNVIRQLQLHRGLSANIIGGDRTATDELRSMKTDLGKSMKQLSSMLRSESIPADHFSQLQSQWDTLSRTGMEWSSDRNLEAHTTLITELQYLSRQVADLHHLYVDPDLDLHYLLDTALYEFPTLLEYWGRIRGLGASILAVGHANSDQQIRMLNMLSAAEAAYRKLQFNLKESARYNVTLEGHLSKVSKDLGEAVQNLADRVRKTVLIDHPVASPQDYFEYATRFIDAGYAELSQVLLPTAVSLLQQRIRGAERDLVLEMALLTLLLVGAGYLFLGIYYSTSNNLDRIVAAARDFTGGDHGRRAEVGSSDEFQVIAGAFNRMADDLEHSLLVRQEGEDRLRAIIDSALDGVIQMDANGKVCGWSVHATAIFGWPATQAIGSPLHELIIPEQFREAHLKGLRHYLATGQGPALFKRLEIEGLHRDGHVFPVELTISPLKTVKGIEFNAFIRDISARKMAEADLRIAAIAFESNEGIVVADHRGRILKVNQAFEEITGYTLPEVAGKTLLMLRSPHQSLEQIHEMRRALSVTNNWQGELLGCRKDGEEFPEWVRVTGVRDEQGKLTHYVISFADITERKQSEEAIRKLAFYDTLTGLPNRALLMDRLKQITSSNQRTGVHSALIFIDLDNFKLLNDTKGHDAGDQLLVQVAHRLTESVREGDTVARLSGDEFVVLIAGLGEDAMEAANHTELIGLKLLKTLGKTYSLNSGDHEIGASIGAVLFKGNEKSIEEILKQADLAMYMSKDAGKNSFRFFDPTMQTAIEERTELEYQLRKGLWNNEFSIYYQAQVDDTGKIIGAEALVRWIHPELGMMSPARFIPLAEETGLILPIGFVVLESVCKTLVEWSGNPSMADISVAVNVSPKQIRLPNFVEQIESLIDYYGVNPRKLKLEITEGVLVSDSDDVVSKMTALKRRGISFSMDDFGTGYSSLSYLKRLPLDQLKIDQSFVRDVLEDANDAAIAKTIVALGNSLGMAVIAEGVETKGQLEFLQSVGCSCYQGYFFSKPLSKGDYEAYVARSIHLIVAQ